MYVSCFHRHCYDKSSWHQQNLKLKQKLFLKLPIFWISQTFPNLFSLTFPNLFLSLFIPQWFMIFFCFASKGNFQSEGVRTPSIHRRNSSFLNSCYTLQKVDLNFHRKCRNLDSILYTVDAYYEIMVTLLQENFIFFADFIVQPWLM